MNLQQLEYIVAVDEQRHFARAAASCYVSQPTLSMMIRKLEEELGMDIFQRSRQPVTPTRNGEEIIAMARVILSDLGRLKAFAAELKGEMGGEVHIGIIPTLAPYLLPLFLKPFTDAHPHLQLFVKEQITDDIISHLKGGQLDIGFFAGPSGDNQLLEKPLFREPFFAYASEEEKLPSKKYVLPADIDLNHLWLLEEGHCLRNQVLNLCELKKAATTHENLHYQAGSIETLINLVDRFGGITIIPLLATLKLSDAQKQKLRSFHHPRPVREISLVMKKGFPRKKLVTELEEAVKKALPFVQEKKPALVLDYHLPA
jgi:LysR family hydrogen peroxide-inducible transcriptional activator